MTFREGVAGALWFRANIGSTPEDDDFWNSMTVEFSDGDGLVWVGLYRQALGTGGAGAPTLIGRMYSATLEPYQGRPIVCLTEMITETSYHLWNGGGTEYTYFIRAGIYRSSPEAAPPTLHLVSVTRWADLDPGFGVLECPGWNIW